MSDLEQFAADAVKRALAGGATDAECTISEGEEFSARVRMREVESLKEAGSRGAGIRVLAGKRTGSSYTSDLSREGIEKMVAAALDLSNITTEDPHAGIPGAEDLGKLDLDLRLYDDAIAGIDTEWKIEQATRWPKRRRSASIRASRIRRARGLNRTWAAACSRTRAALPAATGRRAAG